MAADDEANCFTVLETNDEDDDEEEEDASNAIFATVALVKLKLSVLCTISRSPADIPPEPLGPEKAAAHRAEDEDDDTPPPPPRTIAPRLVFSLTTLS